MARTALIGLIRLHERPFRFFSNNNSPIIKCFWDIDLEAHVSKIVYNLYCVIVLFDFKIDIFAILHVPLYTISRSVPYATQYNAYNYQPVRTWYRKNKQKLITCRYVNTQDFCGTEYWRSIVLLCYPHSIEFWRRIWRKCRLEGILKHFQFVKILHWKLVSSMVSTAVIIHIWL